MPFLQRSNSRRLQKSNSTKNREKQETKEAQLATIGHHEVFDSIDEAGNEHRRSMAGRPKSAGVEKRRLKRNSSSRRATPVAAKEAVELLKEQPTCGRDLERQGQTIEYTTGFDTFSFPTPSPRMAPRSATFNQRGPSPSPGMMPRSRTYRDSPLLQPCDDSPQIGRAIGSPSNLAAPPTWGRSHTADVVTMRSTAGLPPSRSPPRVPKEVAPQFESPESRNKKKIGWKAFGNLFRSKNTKERFYKVKPESTVVVVAAARDALSPELDAAEHEHPARPPTPLSCLLAPSPGIARPSYSRDPSQSRAPSRQDQRMDNGHRTSLLPKGLGLRMKGGTPLASPRSKSPGLWCMSEDAFGQSQGRRDSPLSEDGNVEDKPLPTPRTPRLDLDLPVLEFPRYSIMFEKQLSSGPRPSLLERRQSKLQRSQSQSQNDRDHLRVGITSADIKRSKTSPSFKRTLSVRIKEEQACTDEPTTAVQRPRQIVRSKTAPSGVISPIPPAFVRPQQGIQHSSSPESPGSAFYSENSLPPTPTTVTTCTDTDSVRRMLEQTEPVWDILTSHLPPARPPTNRSQSHSFSTGAERSFSTDDDQPHHQTYTLPSNNTDAFPRVKSPADLDRQIVQVSVARQVSVSRARTRVMRAMEGTAKPAVIPLRPRIIEFSKNRKSAVGVLEDAAASVVGDGGEDAMPENAAAHSRAASLAFERAVKARSVVSVKTAGGGVQEAEGVPDHPDLGRVKTAGRECADETSATAGQKAVQTEA